MDGVGAVLLPPLNALLHVPLMCAAVAVVGGPFVFAMVTRGGFGKYYDMHAALVATHPFLGAYVFSALVGFFSPYSASVGGHVKALNPGSCTVTCTDRPWKRNPFSW